MLTQISAHQKYSSLLHGLGKCTQEFAGILLIAVRIRTTIAVEAQLIMLRRAGSCRVTAVLCTATQPPLGRMDCPLALVGKAELTTEQTDNIPTGGVSRGLCKLFFSMAFAQNIIHFPLGTDGA